MQSGLNFTFPFQKINKEQRIVTGIATADNPDLVDDVVNFDASVKAFSNWIGNIREMHSPIAVGKLVDWKTVPVSYNGQMYQGIEVSVYISKGAENTWQKILDGTLKGFSIGGNIGKTENVFMERHGRKVREIQDYMLGELSVVDNPCNPAGMFAMIKSVNGKLEYVAGSMQDVFYCEDDGYTSVGGDSSCPSCSEEMMIIGKSEDYDEILINKFIQTIHDSFEKAISDINTVPTDAMAAEAKRGLDWRKEFNRGGLAVGVARARDIMNKDTLSISTVRRMHSFFARHEVDKKGKGFSPGEDGYPSAGRIAWALWGGDPGKSWADAIVNRINNMNKNILINKSTIQNGDFVSWSSSGGDARGKVTKIETNGSINIPDSSFNITGTEEDPALLIQIWHKNEQGWSETNTYVGHKMSTVSKINDLNKKDMDMNKSQDMCKMCEDNGYLQKDMTCPYCDGMGCLDDNSDCSSCDSTGTLMEGDNCPMCKMVDTASMASGGILQPVQGLPPQRKKKMRKDAQMKTEGGDQYPAAAFAYVPDANMPSTWKLRLWESPSAKETVAQVSRAATALTSAGFRGNKVQIPAADLAGVKEKIRAAWHRVNGPDRALPAVLKGYESGDISKMMPMPSYSGSQVIAALQKAVGDVAVMYTHAHGYHWNVRGSDFAQYHALFEAIYTDVYESIDPLAENILKMGGTAPRGLSEFLSFATIDDDPLMVADPEMLAADLAEDNDAVIDSLNNVFVIANAANQQGVCNFVAERIDQHQKWAWQLKVSDDIYEMPESMEGMMVSKNNNVEFVKNAGDLQTNGNYDNVSYMSEDNLTEKEKNSILSKLGEFLFGKSQVVDVNNINHHLRIVSDGNMTQAPHVVVNVGGADFGDVIRDPAVTSSGFTSSNVDHQNMINATPSTVEQGGDSNAHEGAGSGEDALEEVSAGSGSDMAVNQGYPTMMGKSINEGDNEMDFEKVLEGLSSLLDEKLEKVKADISAEVDGKIDAIEKSVSDVQDTANVLSGGLEKVANSGAERKSTDFDYQVSKEDEEFAKSFQTESFWGGVFVPTEICKVLGYDS